jgi:large subunit ribosomal protein L32
MAVPKRKWSKARSRRSRSNYKIKLPALSKCPQCHSLKMPHHVCKTCGYYKGRQVIDVAEA